jgi:hypothetical protein
MKRIIPYILLLAIPSGVLAHYNHPTSRSKTDTSSSSSSRSLILRGTASAFNASYGKNYFELSWNTQDFDHFEIERSLDGEHYESLGTVQSADLAATEYSFRDHFKNITARNYDFFYRLKQFDANGNFIYSKVLIARMYNNRVLASLSVTPDPLANDILVNVQLHENSYVLMKVSDEQGNMVLREGQKALNGANTYTLTGTHSLRPGLYTLEITVNSREKMTMRLAKG